MSAETLGRLALLKLQMTATLKWHINIFEYYKAIYSLQHLLHSNLFRRLLLRNQHANHLLIIFLRNCNKDNHNRVNVASISQKRSVN